jgi:hypothetical protein
MSHTARCLLIFGFLAAAPVFAEQTEWTGVERVVAVGDVHGDFNGFVEVLRSAGIIDGQNHWTGGKTHLVQTGDVPDRGPDTRKAMDLLMDLEKESVQAGGHVHALIGNHEAMMVMGDLRYVTPPEFAAFSDARSQSLREMYWKKEPGSRNASEQTRKKWEDEHPLGWFEQRAAYSAEGKYGKWIRSHNAIVKINDTIFLHGGISPRFATVPLKKINEMIASDLDDYTHIKEDQSPLTADDGPLWYRGMAQEWYKGEGLDDSPDIDKLVDKVLAFNHARRIVIGHTNTGGAIIPRFGGKVIMIDVGLTAIIAAGRAALLLEGDNAFAIHRGQKVALPSDTDGPAFLAYLHALMALEPPKSKLSQFIDVAEQAMAKSQ